MSDENEIEFEGGFFDEAGIDAASIPDDPFGFGNDFWPVFVAQVGKPKVTQNGDKIGIAVRFAVDHPKYQGHFVSNEEKGLGNNWYQLPVPLALRSQIPWDPQGEAEQKAMFNLKTLYTALGFGADEFGKVNGQLMLGRRMLTKIKVGQNDNGFWEFRLNSMKPIPKDGSAEGLNEFGNGATANSAEKAAEDLLAEELKNA